MEEKESPKLCEFCNVRPVIPPKGKLTFDLCKECFDGSTYVEDPGPDTF